MAQDRRISADLFWIALLWIGALLAGITFAVVIGRIAGAGLGAGLFFGIIIFVAVGAFLAAFAGQNLPPPNTVVAPTVRRTGTSVNRTRSGAPTAAPDTAGGDVARASYHAAEAVRALGSAVGRSIGGVGALATGKPGSDSAADLSVNEGQPAPLVSPVEAVTGEGARPAALSAPREGGPDDLKKIRGVGPKLEELLHSLGYFHFDQIAGWSEAEIAWIDSNLEGFNGRATRDEWVAQARLLASGGETEFSQRVDKGEVY